MKKYWIWIIGVVLVICLTVTVIMLIAAKQREKKIIDISQAISGSSTLDTYIDESMQSGTEPFSFKYPDKYSELTNLSESFDGENLEGRSRLNFAESGDMERDVGIQVYTYGYKKSNPVENAGYEGLEWNINHTKERSDIESKPDGIYKGSIPSSINYQEKQYEIKTINGKKFRLSYDWFKPSGGYFKVAEIYYGENGLLKFVVGGDILNGELEKIPEEPFTNSSELPKSLTSYFSDLENLLATVRFGADIN